MLLVNACRLLCSRAISHDAITTMDTLLICFCRKYEELYGASFCTPNLHLHCHLKECFLDFGPASSFWAFPFERFNGVLGSVPTNHQTIEAQLMRKFCTKQQTAHGLENSLQELFQPFLRSKGSLKYEDIPELPLLSPLTVSSIKNHFETCKLVPPVKEACLNSDEHRLIETTLKVCFSDAYERTMLIHKYSRAMYFGGDLYGSVNSIYSNSAMVHAKSNSGPIVPGFVVKFVKVMVNLKHEETVDIYLAAINWLGEHPEKNWFVSPIEVWRKFLPCSFPHTFIPVSYIKCRCAYIDKV